MAQKKWDVFISHASEDKNDFVRPLAETLAQLGVKVWYDEFTLEIGDSLSRSIDEGLAGSKYGIVVISPSFIRKKWPERELRALVHREVLREDKLILPIWFGVTEREVLDFSPTLSDAYALRTSEMDAELIARTLLKTIRPDIYSERPRDELQKTLMGEAFRGLAGRLISAQEGERMRLARELHDDINQRMALLAIELDQLCKAVISIEQRPRFNRLIAQVQEISTDVHRLSYALYPSKLQHLGLSPALKSLCYEISSTGDLEVEFEESAVPSNLPKDIALCLFRIAQEALRNCVKHSDACIVKVILNNTCDEIRLTVSDDGRGFDMASGATNRGLGFISMRERLQMVGGRIEVQSDSLSGTRIQASVPLSKEII